MHGQRTGLASVQAIQHPDPRKQYSGTQDVADVSPGRPFYILIENKSKKVVHEPKQMTVLWAMDRPNTIAVVDISLIDYYENKCSDMLEKDQNNKRNAIVVVYYKPPIDGDTQMEGHHTVEKKGSYRLTHNWEEEVHLSSEYTNHREAFLTMLSKFVSMWDEHLRQIFVVKRLILLTLENTQSIRSAPYLACPKDKEFE